MNNLIKISFTLMMIHLIGHANAQIAKELISKYPAFVIYRLNEITSKTGLSLQKQRTIAEYFLNQDRAAGKALLTGVSPSGLGKFYSDNDAYLKIVLSPLEYNDYIVTEGTLDQQLQKVIKYRMELKLSNQQLSELMTTAKKNQTESDPLDASGTKNSIPADDSMVLTSILTKQQYSKFFYILVRQLSVRQTNESWKELKKSGLVVEADSSKLYPKNMEYFIAANTVEAQSFEALKRNKIDSIRESCFVFKPIILWKQDMLNSTMPASQFADVLKMRAILHITNKQIDSLLADAVKLQQIRKDYIASHPHQKFDAAMFEGKNLIRTMSSAQYTAYLKQKNMITAMTNEKKVWNRLKQYGLNTGIDSIKTNNELINYQLNLLVASERYHVDDSPENAEIRSKAERAKPPILKELDLAVKTNSGNAMAKKQLSW